MKLLFAFTLILSCALFVSCGSDNGEADSSAGDDGSNPNGQTDPSSRDGSKTGSTFGFESPDEALDAYTKALTEADEEAFRKIAANYDFLMERLDGGISFHTDVEHEEAARRTLIGIADLQGLADGVLSKRFPVEIDGESAMIVNLYEDYTIDDQFWKWEFEKMRGKWNIVGDESGDAKDLPGDYKWDKNIADVSAEMRDFISGFNGESDAVEAALAKYKAEGAKTGIFSLYGFRQPAVIQKEEADGTVCYTLSAIGGKLRHQFLVYWKDGKIVSIKDKELIEEK